MFPSMTAGLLPHRMFLILLGLIMLQDVMALPPEDLPEATRRTGVNLLFPDGRGYHDPSEIVRGMLRHPLTMDGAVRIALLNNRNLRVTMEEIGIARAEWVEAATLPNPAIDLGIEYPMLGNMANRYVGQIAQDVVGLAMKPLRKRIAAENLEATRAKVASEVVTLVAEVKKAFFTVQADQKILESMRRMQETREGSLDLARRQREAGNITEFALLQRDQQCQEGRITLAETEALGVEHREDLNVLMGLDGEQTRWRITSALPRQLAEDAPETSLLKLAEDQRLDLQAACREARVHAVALKLTKAFRWVPVLDFGVVGERDIDYAFNAGPSFRMELPIFNQGQSRLLRERSLLRRSVAKLQGLSCSIRSEVRKDSEKLRLLRERLRLYEREILPTAKGITGSLLEQYNAMQVSPYDLFQARSAEFAAGKEYETTLRDYWITRTDLERAVGGTFRRIPNATESPAKSSRPSKKS